MKQSRYTVSATDADGATILYNTLTQALAVCPDGVSAQDAPSLAEEGLFVADDADEVTALRARYARDCATTENFCLAIAPTLECNFACPYCYEREVKHAGLMSTATQDALVAWIERNFKALGSSKLKILWYGGEPLMGLSVIERVSALLLEAGLPLEATAISNCGLVTPEVAAKLAACKVQRVTATLDGVGATHDAHRPTLSGKPSFDAIIAGLGNLLEAGIEVGCLFNEDRGNSAEYDQLKASLDQTLPQVELTASQVFDYCQCLDKCADFTREKYDLFTDPQEFALRQYQRSVAAYGLSDQLLASLMTPLRLFCSRQAHTYFVIDEAGRLYECDGDVGYTDRALGSIFDDQLPAHAPYDPFVDPLCESCAYLPLCMGNCRWTRDCIGASCAPQKAIIQEVLHDWRTLLDEGGEGVRILRPATNPDLEGTEPYTLWL